MMRKYGHEIRWTLVFVAATLLWMVIERIAGLHSTHIDKHASYTNLFAVVAIAIYVLALRAKKQQLDGKLSFKEGVISGSLISVGVGLLSPLSQWITHKLISPAYFSNATAYGVNAGLTTPEEAEAYFNLGNYIMISAVSAPLMGIVTAVVVMIFLRTK